MAGLARVTGATGGSGVFWWVSAFLPEIVPYRPETGANEPPNELTRSRLVGAASIRESYTGKAAFGQRKPAQIALRRA